MQIGISESWQKGCKNLRDARVPLEVIHKKSNLPHNGQHFLICFPFLSALPSTVSSLAGSLWCGSNFVGSTGGDVGDAGGGGASAFSSSFSASRRNNVLRSCPIEGETNHQRWLQVLEVCDHLWSKICFFYLGFCWFLNASITTLLWDSASITTRGCQEISQAASAASLAGSPGLRSSQELSVTHGNVGNMKKCQINDEQNDE